MPLSPRRCRRRRRREDVLRAGLLDPARNGYQKIMSFVDLGLSDKVLQAVTAAGYTEPTPIQSQAIPHVLARRDADSLSDTRAIAASEFVGIAKRKLMRVSLTPNPAAL